MSEVFMRISGHFPINTPIMHWGELDCGLFCELKVGPIVCC